jgi:hypothetical protein
MEILLKGGIAMVSVALMLAWLGTFARWFVIKGVDGGVVKDYGLLVKAHIDYILMSLFCFAFYGVGKSAGIVLPQEACWLVVIGGMTNPSIFVIAMLKPDFWQFMLPKIYTAASFITTTVGFIWVSLAIIQAI